MRRGNTRRKGRENRIEDTLEVPLAKDLTKSAPPNCRPRKPPGHPAGYVPLDPHWDPRCWSGRKVRAEGERDRGRSVRAGGTPQGEQGDESHCGRLFGDCASTECGKPLRGRKKERTSPSHQPRIRCSAERTFEGAGEQALSLTDEGEDNLPSRHACPAEVLKVVLRERKNNTGQKLRSIYRKKEGQRRNK